MEWWSGGVVEWWSGGVVEWWSSVQSTNRNLPLRGLSPYGGALAFRLRHLIALWDRGSCARAFVDYNCDAPEP
jgi:hypothetical protein